MDGSLRSAKVYILLGFTALNYAYLWFDKIDQTTLIAMVVPSFVAWLIAHVVHKANQIRGTAHG